MCIRDRYGGLTKKSIYLSAFKDIHRRKHISKKKKVHSSIMHFILHSSAPFLLSRSLLARNYHERVIDHYENPRNVGSFAKNEQNVGTGLVGAPACGDVMKLQIKVDDNGKIIDAKFKTFGCGSAIAASSLATEWVKGKSVDEALQIKKFNNRSTSLFTSCEDPLQHVG
eukprot:TRINITY_DN1863_c0_g1_i2.p1 TRINITY_DN1863_c0_g1~~TRINITY_DN1863_c0_g1_i2.p1  ORF type:complete len:169 (+),score=44.38 TRINITY_DN1863_c0_g1_i2:27-533(+)